VRIGMHWTLKQRKWHEGPFQPILIDWWMLAASTTNHHCQFVMPWLRNFHVRLCRHIVFSTTFCRFFPLHFSSISHYNFSYRTSCKGQTWMFHLRHETRPFYKTPLSYLVSLFSSRDENERSHLHKDIAIPFVVCVC